MIAADRLALQANVVQAISSNLRMLVDLYAGNLNSISVQATVLAALGYASVASTNFNNERLNSENKIISGLYFATAITCLICAMLCVILCTIAAVYGPQLALTGDSNATIIKGIVVERVYIFFLNYHLFYPHIYIVYITLTCSCGGDEEDPVSGVLSAGDSALRLHEQHRRILVSAYIYDLFGFLSFLSNYMY